MTTRPTSPSTARRWGLLPSGTHLPMKSYSNSVGIKGMASLRSNSWSLIPLQLSMNRCPIPPTPRSSTPSCLRSSSPGATTCTLQYTHNTTQALHREFYPPPVRGYLKRVEGGMMLRFWMIMRTPLKGIPIVLRSSPAAK